MSVVRIRRKGGKVVQDCDVYIGRGMNQGGWRLPQSQYANPFKVGGDTTVEEAVIKYYKHVMSRPDLIENLPELADKVLGCWCKNSEEDLCHGDVLVWLANGTISPAFEALMRGHPEVRWELPMPPIF